MAVGPSAYTLNKVLDAIGNNTSFAVAQVYVQLHTGNPGANGTSNVATETTRKAVSFAAASGGSMASDADVSWTNMATADPDVLTHVSYWDASTSGNFLESAALTASKTVNDGDNLTIPSGSLVIAGTPAS